MCAALPHPEREYDRIEHRDRAELCIRHPQDLPGNQTGEMFSTVRIVSQDDNRKTGCNHIKTANQRFLQRRPATLCPRQNRRRQQGRSASGYPHLPARFAGASGLRNDRTEGCNLGNSEIDKNNAPPQHLAP